MDGRGLQVLTSFFFPSHQRTFVLEVMGRHCGYVRDTEDGGPCT